jgi:hypothetical protein
VPRQLFGADMETALKRFELGMNSRIPTVGDAVKEFTAVEVLTDSRL